MKQLFIFILLILSTNEFFGMKSQYLSQSIKNNSSKKMKSYKISRDHKISVIDYTNGSFVIYDMSCKCPRKITDANEIKEIIIAYPESAFNEKKIVTDEINSYLDKWKRLKYELKKNKKLNDTITIDSNTNDNINHIEIFFRKRNIYLKSNLDIATEIIERYLNLDDFYCTFNPIGQNLNQEKTNNLAIRYIYQAPIVSHLQAKNLDTTVLSKVKDSEDYKEKENCIICRETVYKKEINLSCGHNSMHYACLAQWMEMNLAATCPKCRKKIVKEKE